jgi:hypothetical protein
VSFCILGVRGGADGGVALGVHFDCLSSRSLSCCDYCGTRARWLTALRAFHDPAARSEACFAGRRLLCVARVALAHRRPLCTVPRLRWRQARPLVRAPIDVHGIPTGGDTRRAVQLQDASTTASTQASRTARSSFADRPQAAAPKQARATSGPAPTRRRASDPPPPTPVLISPGTAPASLPGRLRARTHAPERPAFVCADCQGRTRTWRRGRTDDLLAAGAGPMSASRAWHPLLATARPAALVADPPPRAGPAARRAWCPPAHRGGRFFFSRGAFFFSAGARRGVCVQLTSLRARASGADLAGPFAAAIRRLLCPLAHAFPQRPVLGIRAGAPCLCGRRASYVPTDIAAL